MFFVTYSLFLGALCIIPYYNIGCMDSVEWNGGLDWTGLEWNGMEWWNGGMVQSARGVGGGDLDGWARESFKHSYRGYTLA